MSPSKGHGAQQMTQNLRLMGVRLPRLSELLQRKPIKVEEKVTKIVLERGISNILRELDNYLKGLHEVAIDVLSALCVGRHVLLVGPVGIGKTSLAEAIAEILHLDDPPYIFCACHSHMTATELTGDIDIAVALQAGLDHPLAYIPGPLVMAHGRILILDEINRLSPYSQAALLQALQEHYVVIRGIRIRSDFLVIATANPVEYSGVFELTEALADRMKYVELNYPDADLLKAIIRWKVDQIVRNYDVIKIPEEFLDTIVAMIGIMRSEGLIEAGPSVRACIYAVASTIARALVERREPTLEDLKREVIQNFIPSIRGEFQSETDKKTYLEKVFERAVYMVTRGSG